MTQAEDIRRVWSQHRRRCLYEVWIPRIGTAVLISGYLACVWYGLKVWSEQ